MENQEQEAKDGYREIFLCEEDHPALDLVTCRNFRNPNASRKRVRKVINVVN
jgi:hypothetical protein